MTAKFLVLGSNSFSGAFFCGYLANLGYEVLATSRSEEADEAFLPYKWGENAAAVRYQKVDLNSDLESLKSLLANEKPTHVVNFAAQSMVAESWVHPDHWMMTNVVSAVRLHDLLRNYSHLERYVHITTPEVYGSTHGWVDESCSFNPSTPYAVSRAAGDLSLRTYFQQYQFPVLFTRAANVYGPGQQLYRIIPRTIFAALTGQKLRLDGGGKSVRVFIHMSDVSDATLKIALGGTLGETYHISGYELVSIRQCVEMILEALGKPFEDFVEIGPERAGKDTAYTLDSRKLRCELGWRDVISLRDGIMETVEWMRRFERRLDHLPAKYIHKA